MKFSSERKSIKKTSIFHLKKRCKLVNSLKGVSARLLRKKGYPSVLKHRWGKSLWSPSYFAGSCGGAPIEIIRQYIESQKMPN
jgi:putative transposase